MFHRLVGVGRRLLKYLSSAVAKRRIRRHRRLLLLEPLAARQVMAAFTHTADSANLTINSSSENLSITSDSTDYIITTSGSGWSGTAGTGVSVSGTALRLAKSTFTNSIAISDQSGISGGSVTFTSNSSPTYNADFAITLNDSPGAVTFAASANPSFGAKSLSVSTTGSNGNIVFSSNATVAATSGNISLTSGGAITFASTASVASTSGNLSFSAGTTVTAAMDSTADVTGTTVSITAGTGISVNTAATSATLNVTGTGAINVSDTAGGLIVTSATTAAGSISLSATGGNLELTSVVAVGGAFNGSTSTSGNILVDSVSAANSTVTLNAVGAIEEAGSGDAAADLTGNSIALTAGAGIGGASAALEIDAVVGSAAGQLSATVVNAGLINVEDTAGGVTVTGASTFSGAITIGAVGGDLTVLTATAGGSSTNMTLSTTTSGNVIITSLSNSGDRVTVNSAGSIVDSADTVTDITAADVVLIAATGIGIAGSASDTELEISATNLDIRNATSGGVRVNGVGGSLTVSDVDASGGAHLLNGGGYIMAANALTLSMSLTTDENFTFTAGISSTANDDLTINNNATITLTNAASRTLTLQAGDDLILGTGSGGAATTAGGGSHTLIVDVDREGAAAADSDRGSVTQDSTAGTRLTAATLTVTAPDGVGSSGQSVAIAAGVLTVNTTGNNGSQFLVEADGLTEFSLTAGTGAVTLATSAAGDLLSTDSAVDISAAAATITVATGKFGGSDVAAGNAIETSVDSLTVTTSGANGIFVRETAGLTALSLNAGSGGVLLHVLAGSVTDTDGTVDVTAASFGFSSAAGALGASANLINTAVTNLEVNAAGDVYISNSIDLIVGSVNSVLTGIDATGEVDIRTIGSLSVNENVTTTTGAVSLQAGESATDDTSDILAISDSVTVSTASGAITLGGGDGVSAGDNSIISATTTVTVNVDNGAGALGVDNDTSAGGDVDFDTTSVDPLITAPGGLTVSGGANEDTFKLKPLTSGTLTVNGGGPALPTGSDQLTLDLSAVAVGKATVLLGASAASGVMSFGTGETEKSVTFTSVEEVSATPTTNPYHLVLDMAYSGFADSVADTIAIQRTAGATGASTDDLLEIEVNNTGVPYFSGVQNGILSLTVIGSSDDDLFQITETAVGFPLLATVAPTVGAVPVNNTGLTPPGGESTGGDLQESGKAYLAALTGTTVSDWDDTDVSIHFDGGSSPDVDRIKVILATPHTVSAVGTATQGNLAADLWPAELGGTGAGGLDLLVSFANLASVEPVEMVGAGGAVLAGGSATSATTEITIRDFDPDTDDGVNIVEGNNGFVEQKFSGFSWLYALGGDGAETIVLESLDVSDPDASGPGVAVSLVTLDGDNVPSVMKMLTASASQTATGTIGTDLSDDTLVVEALPANVTVILMGGAGNDRFLIYNDQDTTSTDDDSVSSFEGTLVISPAAMLNILGVDLVGRDESGGTDTLIIRDFGDETDPASDGGDSVSIVSSRETGTAYVNGVSTSVDTVETSISGLFDAASSLAARIVYSQIESVTLELGSGDDQVSLDFQGLADELDSVWISGNDGDDEFTFLSDTPYGADKVTPPVDADIPVLTIMGELGDDQFIFMDSAELFGIGTCIDGGDGEDKLDFSNFFNERAVYLVTIGSIDGYQGYEGDWGIAKGGGQLGGGDLFVTREQGDYPCFTNIDVLEGTPTPYDVLYGADRATYWNLDGYGDLTLDAGIVMDGIPLSIDAECPCGGYIGQDLAFTSIENLYGGGQRDWFDIGPSFSLTGAIGGGDHAALSDTLDMRDRTDDLSVDLTELTASFAGGIDVAPDISPDSVRSGRNKPRIEEEVDLGASIENLLGGSGDDTLIGDVDVNWIAGYAGDDTLNGKAGVDSVDGGAGDDVLQVEGTEAANDVLIGGLGESLDPLDYDLLVNIGSQAVTLSVINNDPTDFTNSIDEYDGNGAGLLLVASGGRMHLGSTLLTNTPTVVGGAGNDAVTVSFDNTVATAYSGGAGTADSLTLTLEATDIQAMVASMTLDDIIAIQAFINAPTAGPLTLTGSSEKGNFTVANDFETVRIAVYDSGQIVDITGCFGQLYQIQQLQFGTDSDDSLTGSQFADLIFGMGGTDNISGLGGSDCLFGGAGDDTILGGDNTDTIAGGEGDDSLSGDAAADRILGGLGNDSLLGSFGNDILFGNAGTDTLLGGDDVDRMYGGSGNDSLDGEAGNDSIWGQAGDDTLRGSSGDDVLDGGTDSGSLTAHDTVDGGEGNDIIQTQGCESEFDSIQGGPGSNSLISIDLDGTPANLVFHSFLAQNNNILIINGNGARITGNDDPNVLDFRITPTASVTVNLLSVPAIDGCAGDDTIYGTLGKDTIFGSSDNDTIYGYNLADYLDGGTGDDSIYGGADADTIFGGDGNDMIEGQTGNDSIYGGRDNDRLFGIDGDDTLDGQQGVDTLDGGGGNDTFLARRDEAEFDVLNGGAGADLLVNTAPAGLVLNGFDGPNNALESVLGNSMPILGNNLANNLDFRYGATTSFVQLVNVSFVSGEAGGDTIRGSNIGETLFGGDGADTIYGNGGADIIDGGTGNDVLFGGSEADVVTGGTGDDNIDGGTGNDTLSGGAGADILEGGDGDDILNGGEGIDSVSGSGGSDEIRTQSDESAQDTMRGGIGSDRIVNLVVGGALVFRNFDGPAIGIELIVTRNSAIIGDGHKNVFDFRLSTSTKASFVALNSVTRIDMGDGDDTVFGTAANDTIYGRGGNDSINGLGGNDTIFGDGGADVVNGGDGNDRIEGGSGNDTLNGEAGADIILGQADIDQLSGGVGDDTLDGGDGVSGGSGDTVRGDAGNDNILIRGNEAEFDLIKGGTGTDRLTNDRLGVDLVLDSLIALPTDPNSSQIEMLFANGGRLLGNANANRFDLRLSVAGSSSVVVNNLVGIDGLGGNDTIHGTKGVDSISGGEGNDFIYGYGGSDSLSGGDGDDSIDGGAGNDLLLGDAGGDTLLGGAGNDSLVGGLGVDRITSGAGNDIFRFDSVVGDSSQIDVMVDFSTSDFLRFVGYAFDTGAASYVKLNLSSASTTNAVIHLTKTGDTINATTIKQLSTPGLKKKPTSSKVLFS
jgi:Ca2+-binding RTX toxin-like protein